MRSRINKVKIIKMNRTSPRIRNPYRAMSYLLRTLRDINMDAQEFFRFMSSAYCVFQVEEERGICIQAPDPQEGDRFEDRLHDRVVYGNVILSAEDPDPLKNLGPLDRRFRKEMQCAPEDVRLYSQQAMNHTNIIYRFRDKRNYGEIRVFPPRQTK